MTGVSLRLDVERWRESLRATAGRAVGLVPVAKGNGYGFGLPRLAAESARLGVDTVAVGMPFEVDRVRDVFAGSVVVLMPWVRGTGVEEDQRVVSTVARVGDLEQLAGSGARVLVEVRTSVRRHGIAPEDLPAVRRLLGGVAFEGWTVHLPLAGDRYAEAERLARAALAVAPAPLWLSHLPPDDTRRLAAALGGAEPAPVRSRVGTTLWLGDRGARRSVATVLDLQPVARGERAGYRQRRVPGDGWVVTVAGGTAHGIGLQAPTAAATLAQRAVALAGGALEAAGLALSPYTIAGRKRWFLEPPHMQSSLLFLPRRVPVPAVGDEVPVEVRSTTVTYDRVVDL